MKIEFINYPWAFTDTGRRIRIGDVKGNVSVGVVLDEELKVISNATDNSCVSGVCPIR